MAVYRNRSTIRAPEALSISYLIGSPPTGTSTMTFTSFGGSRPIATASRRIYKGPQRGNRAAHTTGFRGLERVGGKFSCGGGGYVDGRDVRPRHPGRAPGRVSAARRLRASLCHFGLATAHS